MSRRSRVVIAVAALLAAALATALERGTAEAQHANSEAAMILRVLNYDRALGQRSERSGDVALIGLYSASDAGSRAFCGQLTRAIDQLGRAVRVAGRRVRGVPHAYRDGDDLVAAGARSNAVAVYVCAGLGGATRDIAAATRRASILSIASGDSQVRGGLTIGLVRTGAQLRLVVNLESARAEGARLDAGLLRLATVLR